MGALTPSKVYHVNSDQECGHGDGSSVLVAACRRPKAVVGQMLSDGSVDLSGDGGEVSLFQLLQLLPQLWMQLHLEKVFSLRLFLGHDGHSKPSWMKS